MPRISIATVQLEDGSATRVEVATPLDHGGNALMLMNAREALTIVLGTEDRIDLDPTTSIRAANGDYRGLLRRVLKMAGYQPYHATNGPGAHVEEWAPKDPEARAQRVTIEWKPEPMPPRDPKQMSARLERLSVSDRALCSTCHQARGMQAVVRTQSGRWYHSGACYTKALEEASLLDANLSPSQLSAYEAMRADGMDHNGALDEAVRLALSPREQLLEAIERELRSIDAAGDDHEYRGAQTLASLVSDLLKTEDS